MRQQETERHSAYNPRGEVREEIERQDKNRKRDKGQETERLRSKQRRR
jgi:hypothetical protein